MFAKLLKYEWKANVKLLSLLGGCALGLGCIAALVLRLLTGNFETIADSEIAVLLMIPSVFFLFAAFMGIFLFSVCVQYILLYRFYKSRFTDEGYLMFTLPVKTTHLFLSSAVNHLIWSAIAYVVIILSFAIAIGLGPVWPDEFTREFSTAFTEMSILSNGVFGPGYAITGIFSVLVMGVYSVVGPMSAVVLGASLAKKHKILAIIGILIGLSMVTGMASGIITGLAEFIVFAMDDLSLFTTIMPLLNCIVPLALTIGGYFLSIHIMKHRLNLP